jgi:hypothetical protein
VALEGGLSWYVGHLFMTEATLHRAQGTRNHVITPDHCIKELTDLVIKHGVVFTVIIVLGCANRSMY